MTRELAEEMVGDTPALFADGYDDCILGICSRAGQDDVVAYDMKAIISKLINQGLKPAEAVEFYDFNIVAAYVGPGTPVFVDTGESVHMGGVVVA